VRRALSLLLLLAVSTVEAAEVSPTLADGKLGMRVSNLAFPTTLPKELGSGLTNRLYVRVSLLEAGQLVEQRVVELTIRYDLWDERFIVNTTNGATIETRTVADAAGMNALLAALPLPTLFDEAAVPRARARALVLRAEILLNPIGREKLRMIRKWVAQNSTPDVGADQAVSVTNGIFNRIFEQYADGTDIAAVWREVAESKPFRIDDLANEKR
jgi:hypothetical protein